MFFYEITWKGPGKEVGQFFMNKIFYILPSSKVRWNCSAKWSMDKRHLNVISSWDHCQRFSPSQISDMQWPGFEPILSLSSDFVCAEVINTYNYKYKWTYKYWWTQKNILIQMYMNIHYWEVDLSRPKLYATNSVICDSSLATAL